MSASEGVAFLNTSILARSVRSREALAQRTLPKLAAENASSILHAQAKVLPASGLRAALPYQTMTDRRPT
jgi:hypothetical protein